jgi:L-seryl-tRNA(Ser) seleniumtransferase
VQRLLEMPEAGLLVERFSRASLVDGLRSALDEARSALERDAAKPAILAPEALLARAGAMLEEARRPRLRRVVNATGIILHTNLGRAPLAAAAIAAVAEVATGYADLEFDLADGRRGSRHAAVSGLFRRLTGAPAALVVNNNAAAVLLALTVVAGDGEAIVSRGELVEIGGSFRIPDVVRQSGARLVEVGTTNRTRLADYERALTPATRALLRVHQSNYRIVGFTEACPSEALAALARRHRIALVEDLGSGTLLDLRRIALPYEKTVAEALAGGADLVTFSGDKLLGGPQAGIVVGRADLVERLTAHPLYRALRIDKMSLAALEATLRLHLDPDRLAERLPVLRLFAQSPASLEERAGRLIELLDDVPSLRASTVEGEGFAGGGALPGVALPTWLVRVEARDVKPAELARRLRAASPPVIGRMLDGALAFDMRTVGDDEVAEIAGALRQALP